MTDKELEIRIREELYLGSVESAENYLHDVQDPILKQELKQVIREYVGLTSSAWY